MTEPGWAGLPVFLVPSLPDGGGAVLEGDEARHAVTVRRIRKGERVVLTDGAGGLAECVATAVRQGRDAGLDLEVQRSWRQQAPRLRVTVVQALVKGDRGELAVELATEAGADAIVPWRAARSVARWDDGPRGAKALARWRGTVRSAAKQARRAWIPEVREPVDTAELAGDLAGVALGLVLDAEAPRSIADISLPDRGELALVIGPEGGISPGELDELSSAGACPVRLGPTVLRASTAAAVGLGALGVRTDRW